MHDHDIKRYIRDVPDFPQPGILFRDVTPLLKEPTAFRHVVAHLEDWARTRRATSIAAIEARGFMFGAPLAQRLALPFVPVRKPGKLPWETMDETYELEYGSSTLQVHKDAFAPSDRVLVVDDLLATGGTAAATARLVRRAGAEVAGALFVVELKFLDGRRALGDIPTHALVEY